MTLNRQLRAPGRKNSNTHLRTKCVVTSHRVREYTRLGGLQGDERHTNVTIQQSVQVRTPRLEDFLRTRRVGARQRVQERAWLHGLEGDRSDPYAAAQQSLQARTPHLEEFIAGLRDAFQQASRSAFGCASAQAETSLKRHQPRVSIGEVLVEDDTIVADDDSCSRSIVNG